MAVLVIDRWPSLAWIARVSCPLLARAPGVHRAVAAALKARIETLEAELAKLEAAAAVHWANFEHGETLRPAHGGGAQDDGGPNGGTGSAHTAALRFRRRAAAGESGDVAVIIGGPPQWDAARS